MNRREYLKVAGAAAMSPMAAAGLHQDPADGSAKVECSLARLNLRHTWTTTMSSSEYRETVQLRYSKNGIEGYGEGAPIIRYKETPESARKAINRLRTG